MLRPLRNLLYIIPMEDRQTTAGGLYIPDTGKQRVDQGIVKYRGPDTTGEIKRGDHVIFSGYDGSQVVTEDDGLLIVIPEPFIIGIHEDDQPSYVFTQTQVTSMIDGAIGDLKARLNISVRDLEVIGDYVKTHINTHFYRSLHF